MQVRVAAPAAPGAAEFEADCSMLFEREWTDIFFLGLSTVDFERGRPILGNSPTWGILASGGTSESPLISNGIGEGEWLANPRFELWRMLRKDLRKALELLRLQFQSSVCGFRTMELCDTAGVRKEPPISSLWEHFRLRFGLLSSGNELDRLYTINLYTFSSTHRSAMLWHTSSLYLSCDDSRN